MFTIEYVDSADPLVEIVKSSPSAVFERPFMGYIFFLFGEADHEAAAWIRENLQALDSLTGPDIAGAVFVKSFEIEAHVERAYTTRPLAPKIQDGKVELRDVRHVDRHEFAARAMFNDRRDLEGHARSSLESLKATTYATDEIARSLGLVAELPCIVFLDAVPGEAKPLRLSERNLPSAIRIIRETIGNFMKAPGYIQQRHLLSRAHDLGLHIHRLREILQELAVSERAERNRVWNELPRQLLDAKKPLLDGSARQFVHRLKRTGLDRSVIEDAAARAERQAHCLTHLARTIRGISWYAEVRTSPIIPDELDRISRIYREHVTPLLGVCTPVVTEIDAALLSSTLCELRAALHRTIEDIWGDLPNPDALREAQVRAAAAVSEAAGVKRTEMEEELDRVSAELSDNLRALASGPRLTEIFASVAKARSVDESEATAPSPEFLEAALRSISAGAVRFVGRDIYIGTNVAAMGPSARAKNTAF